jgi:crotonobetainyl-CoA:carnitine CoA-transferase CaiB-like acyl-CoA transferase
MLVYVTDLGKTGKVYLYHPNSKDECTQEFMRFFIEQPFEEMTDDERKKYKTKAYFKTNEETWLYWRDLFQRLQDVFDKYDERDMIDELKMNGLPIYVPSTIKKRGNQ